MTVIEELRKSQALLEGHFLLSSGKHSNAYVQCARLLQYPERAKAVISEIAKEVEKKKMDIDLVVGPAMGGIIVAYELARQLGLRAIFTERENNEMTLRRGFQIKPGEKILLAEDVITTGKSSKETIEVIEDLGGQVVLIASIVDRSQGKIFDQDLISAIKLDIDVYDPKSCPLCEKGMDLVKPGSRKF